jgi:hypothetical protein
VAFCNLNHFDYNFAKDDLINITSDTNINQFNPNQTANEFAVNIGQYIRYNLIRKYMNDLSSLYNMDFTINQMILSCTFQSKKCTIYDFMYHYDYMYGLCWRFNSGKSLKGEDLPIKTSGEVGWMHGLQLELYTGNAELQERFAMKRGFRIFVFNKSTVYPIAADIGIDVSTGHETNIGIKRTFKNHMPAPFSNCLSTNATEIDWNQNEALKFMNDNFITGQYYWSGDFLYYAGDWTWNWTVSYSQSKCVKLCYQKSLFQTCGIRF